MKRNFLQRVGVHLQASSLALVYLSRRQKAPAPPQPKPAPNPTVGKILLGQALLFGGFAWAMPLMFYPSLWWDAFISGNIDHGEAMFVIAGTPLAMLVPGFAGAYVCLWASKEVRALRPRAWRIARFLCFQSFTVAIGLGVVLGILFRRT